MVRAARVNWTSWLVVAAFSLGLSAQAQDRIGGWLEPGDTLVAEEEIVWRTAPAFARLLAAAQECDGYAEISGLQKEEITALRAQIVELEAQVSDMGRVVELADRETSLQAGLVESMDVLFNRVNDELERERKRSRPWIMAGVQLGVGLAHDGERMDAAVYIGYGVTFNVRGR